MVSVMGYESKVISSLDNVTMLTFACWFLQGHSMRIAIAGVDAKHFYVDHVDAKTMWIHTGPGRQSAVSLYVASSQNA